VCNGRYRFKLPTPDSVLGIAVGQHVSVRARPDGAEKDAVRSYTPVSSPKTRGYFELLVKTYEKGVVSRVFSSLSPGDTMSMRGPKGSYSLPKPIQDASSSARPSCIAMIAGGTGITPMYQVLCALLDDSSPNNEYSDIQVRLIYANQTESDILLRESLDKLASMHQSRFKLHYVLQTVR
jgi:cytochrome-b5 reductase